MDHPKAMAELIRIVEGCKLTPDEITTLPDQQVIAGVKTSALHVVFPHESQGIRLNKLLEALNARGTVKILNLLGHPGCGLDIGGILDGFEYTLSIKLTEEAGRQK